jgi:quinoprotein glucose dehydrogenase
MASELVADTNQPARVRADALAALVVLEAHGLDDAIRIAQADASEDLRKAGAKALAARGGTDATSRLASTLKTGTLGEQQAALAALGGIPGPAADELIANWVSDLRAGRVRKELELDVLEAASKRTSPSVTQKLAQYRESKPKDDPLADYQEALFGGEAASGGKIFFDRPEVQCVRCHKVGKQGGDVGPDLTHVGGQKDRRYLLESVILPNKQIAPGFESVMVVLKNGDSFAGVLKSETPDAIVINSPDTGPLTIKKVDVQSRRQALSPMPEGLGQILTKVDLRNLVEFLSSQK